MSGDRDLEERIRQRAYEIWRAEGAPHGRDQDHWDQARRELTSAGGDAVEAVETTKEPDLAAKTGTVRKPKAGAATGAKPRGGKRAAKQQSTAAAAAETADEAR